MGNRQYTGDRNPGGGEISRDLGVYERVLRRSLKTDE